MKRLLTLIFLIFATQTYAQCYEYELIGEGKIIDENIGFIIAKGTQSEVKLIIPFEEQNKFAPYLDRWARARLILDRGHLNFETKVRKVLEVEYQTPDPLRMTSTENIKKLGKVACPKD